MKYKILAALAFSIVVAALPASLANHPSTNCVPTQGQHSYGWTIGASMQWSDSQLGSDEVGASATVSVDSCTWHPGRMDRSGADLDSSLHEGGDGDHDFGVGGGQFPAGSSSCLAAPAVAHHAYGVGAAYWADDETGVASLVYSAGADGPAVVPDPLDPCATDGVISNDPTTDPADCGAGTTGIYALPLWTPATLGETVAGNGGCNPFDGYVWVFIGSGAYVDVDSGNVIVSLPLSGHIWS